MTQHDELAVLRSEFVDDLLERTRQFGVFEVPEGVLGLILHNEFDLVALAVGAIQRHRLEASPAQVVDPEVVADAKEPGRKSVLRIKSFERRPGSDKCLLAKFPSELDIPDELGEERRQAPLITSNEDGEGILFPIKGETHQLFIRGLFKAHSLVMIQGFDMAVSVSDTRVHCPGPGVAGYGVRVRLFAEVDRE